ncbi:MAG: LysE/ArgO family amino acid transporter [Minwuia sp.]|uniref:LysE/ArgO family amino acid transporter n=1 Tax=Minwuia sp. TaxID=2493630 RepID=UPI003A8BBA27
MTALAEGFLLGLSLILAIGAQNAFVLRQGLLRSHVLEIVLVCALADALLIGAGVLGLGALVVAWPGLVFWTTLGGAAFLIVYGLFALRRALRPGSLEAGPDRTLSRRAAVATALAFTFLNPHVYLDTVVMLGGIAARHPEDARIAFWAGGAAASFVFFFSLGYGARFLQPVFARPAAWRVLDLLIALVMWAIAALLLSELAVPASI